MRTTSAFLCRLELCVRGSQRLFRDDLGVSAEPARCSRKTLVGWRLFADALDRAPAGLLAPGAGLLLASLTLAERSL